MDSSNGVVLGFTVKEVPGTALGNLQKEPTAPKEVIVVAQPDDSPRDERDAAHKIELRDVAKRDRSPLADNVSGRCQRPFGSAHAQAFTPRYRSLPSI